MSLETGGGLLCRPNPAATLLVCVVIWLLLYLFCYYKPSDWSGRLVLCTSQVIGQEDNFCAPVKWLVRKTSFVHQPSDWLGRSSLKWCIKLDIKPYDTYTLWLPCLMALVIEVDSVVSLVDDLNIWILNITLKKIDVWVSENSAGAVVLLRHTRLLIVNVCE